ncbi:MAG: hypothetical protein LWX11_00175 [Firmicutes bacterium]|nr:hypothetical protein [Bacillota bacterium]
MRWLPWVLVGSALGAQSTGFAVHAGFARVDAYNAASVGLSGEWAFTQRHALSIRLDHSVGSMGGGDAGAKGRDFFSYTLDWTWHTRGFRSPGFFLGGGWGSVHLRYQEPDALTPSLLRNRERSGGAPNIHFGVQISSHLIVQGRVHAFMSNDGHSTFLSSAPYVSASLGWLF